MSMFETTGGVVNSYRLLLGDEVIRSAIKTIGADNTNRFLKLHAKYDAMVRKHKDEDPLSKMPANEIPAFHGFSEYVKFLEKIAFTLRTFKEPISRALYGVIEGMLKLSKAKPPVPAVEKVESATASTSEDSNGNGSKTIYQNSFLRGHSLVRIPVQIRDQTALPYSYPSWEGTLAIVREYADDKEFGKRIQAELTDTLKAALVKVIAELPKTDHKTVKELVAEAQQYLMDRNWIQYGLENVAHASFNLATAGIKHRVSTNGVITHIATTKTLAYAFLGVNLEIILRRGFFGLAKDISENLNLEGRQAGFDVLCCACSYYVQDIARNWLDNVQSKLK
jgi:hypothetical protein